MPEQVVGTKLKDIHHQVKTSEGSLTITHNTRRDIIANTVGHVFAIPLVHTVLWTWNKAFTNPSPELAGQLFDRYKDVPWKGDVLVRVGHVDLFGDLQRIFAKNEDIRGRPWMLKNKVGKAVEFVGKLGAALLSTGGAFWSKFTRSDYYNVFANTVVVYHPNLAAGMHELGHAEFFNQMDRRFRAATVASTVGQTLRYVPFLTSWLEYKATANAMRHFKNDEERRQGLKMLEAAWGMYLTADTLITLAAIVPAFAIPMLTSPVWTVWGKIAIGGFEASKAFGATYAMYGSAFAGHFMNRLYPRRDQRFGYIFSGETRQPRKDPALADRQVLVGMARPQVNAMRR